jgi:hypothetical protein
MGRVLPFVTVCDFSDLATCYAGPNSRDRPTPATRNFSFLGDMQLKNLLALCLLTACASTFAQATRTVSCKQLVRNAIADAEGRLVKTETRERELCFPGEQDCLNQGGLAAEDIWTSANEPDEAKSVLLNYADYRGKYQKWICQVKAERSSASGGS